MLLRFVQSLKELKPIVVASGKETLSRLVQGVASHRRGSPAHTKFSRYFNINALKRVWTFWKVTVVYRFPKCIYVLTIVRRNVVLNKMGRRTNNPYDTGRVCQRV